jgi:hypothetical protein
LSFIGKGTFHSAILRASHSTIAVFQTPGSQTKAGLFFVFLFNIETSLSISVSLPTILSIFHSRASRVKSVEKKSKAGVVLSCCLFHFGSIFQSKGVVISGFHPKIFCVIAHKSLLIASSFFISSSSNSSSVIGGGVLYQDFIQSVIPSLFKSVIFFSISFGVIQI